VDFVHSRGVIHGDIKPLNILMDGEFNAKLSDFSASRGADGSMTTNVGHTTTYAAPEVLQGGMPTVKSDVYSLGLFICFVVTGEHAFDPRLPLGRLVPAVMAGANLQLPASVRPELAHLTRSMCSPDPENRPGSMKAVFETMCESEFGFFEGIVATEVREGLADLGVEDPFESEMSRLKREVRALKAELRERDEQLAESRRQLEECHMQAEEALDQRQREVDERQRQLEEERRRADEALDQRQRQVEEGRRQVDQRQRQLKTQRELVRALVEGRGVIPPRVVPPHGQPTMLYKNAMCGDVAAIAGFVDCPEFINAQDADGRTPMFYAASCGKVEAVKALWRLGANLETPDKDGCTPLFAAAESGHESIVRLLACLGADVKRPTKDGCTPLYRAAQNGHRPVVRSLASLGADVNAPWKDGCTPLMIAASRGHSAVVTELLKAGASRKAA
jgi:hypothetical protein